MALHFVQETEEDSAGAGRENAPIKEELRTYPIYLKLHFYFHFVQ